MRSQGLLAHCGVPPLTLQGDGAGGSGSVLPAWMEAEARRSLEQVARDKPLAGLMLRVERGAEVAFTIQQLIRKLAMIWTTVVRSKNL